MTQRRLAQGIWGALAPRVAIGLVGFNMALVAGAAQLVPASFSYEIMAASLVTSLVLLSPVAQPYFEMWQFSRMRAEEIEKAVTLPEPVQQNLQNVLQIKGEDALLSWPGASESILAERDQFMAKSLAAAAIGKSFPKGLNEMFWWILPRACMLSPENSLVFMESRQPRCLMIRMHC